MSVSIKTLKQFALKVHNFACGTEWDDEGIVSAMVLDAIIEKMIKDEKMLKEENEKLKKRAMPFGWTEESCKNWIEENEELKEKNNIYIQHAKTLQEENEKLKEKINDFNKKGVEEINKIYQDAVDEKIKKIIDDNKELQEELNTLQKHYDTIDNERLELCNKYDDLVEKNEELKEKLEQKKTKSINRQKYIHYKNIVLKNELDDVSDFEDEDYIGFGEKPYCKDKTTS
jgi:DNA repair exonuclease SbcCD ATPase subunit